MAGRKPKPTHLKLIAGNPGKRPLNRKEPRPKGALFAPPDDLPEAARPFWAHVIASAPAGLLYQLDLGVVKVYVVAAWLHADAVRKVAASTLLARTPNGSLQQNPFLPIVNRQALIMLKAAAEMGFTPSSRSRVQMPEVGAGDDDFSEFA